MKNKFNLLSSSIILNRSRLNLRSLEIRLCYKAMCYHLKIALLQYEQLVYSIKSCEEYFLILLMHNFQIFTWSQDCFELSNFSSISIRSTCLSSMNSCNVCRHRTALKNVCRHRKVSALRCLHTFFSADKVCRQVCSV